MGEIGVHFAKMLLAKQRKEDAALRSRENLKKRAFADISSSLLINVEALNSYPGIAEPVMSVESTPDGFELRGSKKVRRVAFITFQEDDMHLGYIDINFPDVEVWNGRYRMDAVGFEVYGMDWSDRGVIFRKEDEERRKYRELSVDDIVARAFGMVINGIVSPLFPEEV
jgi:hypothetical protein